MKRLQHLCLALIVIVGIGGFTAFTRPVSAANVIIHIGPEAAPAPNPVVYHYVYYPEEEVYFAPESRVYWWSVNGEWRSGPRVPEGILLGATVNLDVDARDPWRHHDVIIARFPGRRHHEREDRRQERREERHEEKHDRD
jgi:hypothetical protein